MRTFSHIHDLFMHTYDTRGKKKFNYRDSTFHYQDVRI